MRRPILSLALAGCLAMSLALPMAAQAQGIQEIVVAAGARQVPAQRVNAGDHVLFRVENPGNEVIYFRIPEVGINYPVAPGCKKTFFLDMQTVDAQRLVYGLTTQSGQQIAGGVLLNEDAMLSDATTVALSNIINYSTAYSAPIQPEPQYRERPVARPVWRGYW